jgi:hypothetical protein
MWRVGRVTLNHLAIFQSGKYLNFADAPFVHPFDRVLSVNQLQGFAPTLLHDHSRKIAAAL